MRAIAIIGGLAASAWLTGNVVLAAVAMTMFGSLTDSIGEASGRSAAGQAFGDILAWWAPAVWPLFALLAVAVVARAGQSLGTGRRAAPLAAIVLTLGLAGTHLYTHHLVGAVAAARDALPADSVASEDPDFQKLHKTSERMMGLETVLVLVVGCLLPMLAVGQRHAERPSDG